MWKLSEIKIRNIVSFKEAALKINQGVATLIFGQNEDNASQPCNGSGKSSLVEAISFGLTGEQLRKVKSVEEIINDIADDAYVFLRLENDYDNTVFTIERTISRTSPQTIECHKYDEYGSEIETDKTVQATMADYNKFILSEIGLTKDDIYNNFILCDNKYESFFDCSDKSKKEIINRFSNGVIVDESISRVQADLEPILVDLNEAKNAVINIQGSISALQNELDMADQKNEDAKEERLSRIARLEAKIQESRAQIEEYEEKKNKGEKRLDLLISLQTQVSELETSDTPLIEVYSQIKSMCEDNDLGSVSDYRALSEQIKRNQEELERSLDEIKIKIGKAVDNASQKKSLLDQRVSAYTRHKEEKDKLCDKDSASIEEIEKEIDKIEKQLDGIEAEIKKCKVRQSELDSLILRNTTILNGAVTCPKCSHQFLLDNEKSVEDVKELIQSYEEELIESKASVKLLNKKFDDIDESAALKSEKIDELNIQIRNRKDEVEFEHQEIRKLSKEEDETEQEILNLKKELTTIENELDKTSGKIEVLRNRLFGEITGILDGRIINGRNFISQQESSISFCKGQISQYQTSKRELVEAPEKDFAASLKKSLEKYEVNLKDAELKANEIQEKYTRLKTQELYFTMFKSHLAKKKIDALSLIVNDFLEKIGSDIRLRLEGFTVTKTGKLRDKISVQVMRDGIDCGSYHKFSGGEKARLNLACILSLHTLTNSNCEDGKGLDFIIIDELLDKSDEMGMATYCEALNRLGQTALLITQGGVSESYPHKLLVVKKQGVSTITN